MARFLKTINVTLVGQKTDELSFDMKSANLPLYYSKLYWQPEDAAFCSVSVQTKEMYWP